MSGDIYSECNKASDDGTLANVIFLDVVRHSRLSARLSLVDSAQYYDSVAHTIVLLIFQAHGVLEEMVHSMLITVEEMK